MSRDQAIGLAWGVGALALVGSSLIGRNLAWRRGLAMAAVWVLIFALLFTVVENRDAIRAVDARALAGTDPARGVSDGATFRVRRSGDGHFHVCRLVNGASANFLVGTGAARTALSAATMAAAAIGPDAIHAGGVVETANGDLAVQRATVASLVVGPVERHDLGVFTPATGDGPNVPGMRLLSTLHGWQVEGEWLVLNP